MSRLTERDRQGHWRLKKLNWDDIRPGERITKEVWEILYGALYKLLKYEDTGLYPDQIREMDKLYLDKCREVNQLRINSAGPERLTDVEKQIANQYGFIGQVNQLEEEMSELTQVLCKYRRKWTRDPGLSEVVDDVYLRERLTEELADVWLVLDQVIYLSGLAEDIKCVRQQKVNRTLKRLADADNPADDHADQDVIAPAT